MSELSHGIARGAIGLGLFAVVTVGVVAMTHSLTAERIEDNRLISQHRALGQVVPESMVGADLLDNTLALPASSALGQSNEFIAWRARK
ncbi:MAG TPA: electron transporter RnfG, partial [Modicisalibacter sp.]|nr:electron transporter RnfG [Modicisalibacter sp.]